MQEVHSGRTEADGPQCVHTQHLLCEVRCLIHPVEQPLVEELSLRGDQVAVVRDQNRDRLQHRAQRMHLQNQDQVYRRL